MWEAEQRPSPEGLQLTAVFSRIKLLLMAADIRDVSEAGTRAIELLVKRGPWCWGKSNNGGGRPRAQKPFEAESSSRLSGRL